MLDQELLSMLCCPACQAGALLPTADAGEDGASDGELRCDVCDSAYPIHFGFPILIPEDSLTGAEWAEWREHLEKFQARRQARIEKPDEAINLLAEKSQPQPHFATFTGIERGRVLDIGCGPGKFRHHFNADRVKYVGLDPMTLPEVSDFPFVQGVAEYLPFQPGSFTDVVVLAALDHFRDLDRFVAEARRILTSDGRLHVLQSVHEVRGPVSAVKVLAHKVKDSFEDRLTSEFDRAVPKHLTEFTSRSLVERFGADFDLVATEQYSATWYSPVKLFLSFAPKGAATAMAQPA